MLLIERSQADGWEMTAKIGEATILAQLESRVGVLSSLFLKGW